MSEEVNSNPVERFIKFLEFVAGDSQLEDRVAALDPGDTSGLLAIAAENGFPFTLEEFKNAINTLNAGSKEAVDEVASEKLLDKPKRQILIINRPSSMKRENADN